MAKASRVRDVSRTRTDAYRVDPRKVEFDPKYQSGRDETSQEYKAAFDRLVKSIAAIGVVVPITVRLRSGKLVCIDGRMRVLAARECVKRGGEAALIPAVQEPRSISAEESAAYTLARHMTTALPARRVNELLARLVTTEWTPEKISSSTGLPLDKVKQAVERIRAASPLAGIGKKGSKVDPRLKSAFEGALEKIRKARTLEEARDITERVSEELAGGAKRR